MENLKAGTGAEKRAPDGSKNSVCPVCEGTGVDLRVDSQGRRVAFPCACGERRRNRTRLLIERADLPALPESVDFAPTARKYVADFPKLRNGANWILFSGRAGSGKTTNAAFLAKELIERYGVETRFYAAYDLTRRLATRKNDERDKLLAEATSVPFVVLDDFLKVFPKKDSFNYADFFEATLEIVWGRYDARLPMAITTQRDFRQVSELDSALAGRLVERCGGRIVAFDKGAANRRLAREERARECAR